MKKRKYLILGIFLLIGFLIFNKTLSELKPIPKVTFKSQNLDYDKKEPGSFKVDKSAKWIGEGKAKITIEVNSMLKDKVPAKDIIFVLDISGSMEGDKLNQVKKDTTNLVTAVLSNPRNRAALITFESSSTRASDFTTNKDEFLNKVNSLDAGGGTNYKAGFEEARKLLEGYKKEEGKDLVLIFLTDGFPNEKTPNEVAIYNELRQTFPYISINAVQYEMGNQIQDQIKAISERQFPADMKGLNNVLFEAGTNPIIYDNFVITDYISKHFKGTVSNIQASQGEVNLGGDKVTWNLGTYKSGTKATLEIELYQVGSREEFYKTNKGIDIKTIFEKQKDDQISSKTPVLKDAYKVIYEANTPNGCTVKNLEKTTSYRPFEKIALVKGNATCEGYLFQGYKLITDAKYINQDYIEMPEKDVIFRAIWTKVKVDKGMQGKVAEEYNLYNVMKKVSLGNDKEKGIDYSKVNSEINGEGVYLFDETKNDTYPVYFFRGTHQLKNNLLYANFCWKIVRTTETGGVRIVYNGSSVNGKCTNTTGGNTKIGSNEFNISANKKQYVGYMYGDDRNPYQNTNDSDIKKYIDNWYKTNIKDKGFESSLDKQSIYCGDRTEYPDGTNINYMKNAKQHKPSTRCPSNDSYGVEAGNRKLTYAVGLLTIDETILAGTNWSTRSRNYYLYTNYYYWLLSPSRWDSSGSEVVLHGFSSGSLVGYRVDGVFSVRPAVTIASSAQVLSGDGSQNNPYVI